VAIAWFWRPPVEFAEPFVESTSNRRTTSPKTVDG
jgi:hypothetical protein